MKKHSASLRLTSFVLAVAIAASACALTCVPSTAAAQGPIPCSMIETVLDCYSSFSTANYPDKNVNKYDMTYRNLTFRKSYALTGTTCLWTTVGVGPTGVPGYISRMKCEYKTW